MIAPIYAEKILVSNICNKNRASNASKNIHNIFRRLKTVFLYKANYRNDLMN
jgi:hypothetical protein